MKLARITTPPGSAAYPWLNQPDTKFDSQRAKGGEYHVDLVVPEKDAADLVAKLESMLAEWTKVKNTEQKEAKKKPFKLYNNKPWSEMVDEEGNPTGEWVFKFKRGAEWTDRDGNVRKNTIKFVDTHGKGITNLDEVVGSGSTLRVCFQVRGWASPLGVCVALDLVAVQIIDLVAYSGGEGTDFGFAAEEGSFSHEERVAAIQESGDDTDGDF